MTDTDFARQIAGTFLDAAEKAAVELQDESKQKRESFRKRWPAEMEEFEKELEPIMTAITGLPPREGWTASMKIEESRGLSGGMDVTLTLQKADEEVFHSFCLTTGLWGDRKTLRVAYHEQTPQRSGGDNAQDPKNYAEARNLLAKWFMRHLPWRLTELKEALLQDPHNHTTSLQRDISVDRPLKLKSGNSSDP